LQIWYEKRAPNGNSDAHGEVGRWVGGWVLATDDIIPTARRRRRRRRRRRQEKC